MTDYVISHERVRMIEWLSGDAFTFILRTHRKNWAA